MTRHLLTNRAPGPPALLLVSGLYPTPDRPEVGTFVARRVEALERRGVHVRVVAAPSYHAGRVDRYTRMAIRALTITGSFDGVESHGIFPTGLIGAAFASTRRVPHVTYVHGSDVTYSAQRSPIHGALARVVARSASTVVANSRFSAAMVARFGVTATVVPPGIDLARFSPGPTSAARERTGLPARARIAMFVGRFALDKGADLFADAVDGADGWLGVMIGNGPLRDQIVERHPGIVMVGFIPSGEVSDWLRSADVVVVPSRREGLGLVAIEALASGVPVVAAATGGLIETVDHERNGLLVDPANTRAIVAALTRLADDAVRTQFGAHGPLSVARHDIERSTDAMALVWDRAGVDLERARR
jgi:teichuronic acid biosynthesis glycosyltransferase TuaC